MFQDVAIIMCFASLNGPPRCECVPAVKPVTKTLHDVKCVEYCSPRWSLGDWWFGRTPVPGECGRLRTKKVLLKFTMTHEERTIKCEPVPPITGHK